IASGLELQAEENQVNALIYTMGEEAEDILTSLCLTPDEAKTDHKPLVSLLGSKNLDELPPRIQRLRMRLMKFTYTVSHVPGKNIATADVLSRVPDNGQGENQPEEELNLSVIIIELGQQGHQSSQSQPNSLTPSHLTITTTPHTPPSQSSPPPKPSAAGRQSNSHSAHCPSTFTADQVRRQLRRLHPRKAAGPDKVCPRMLKACAAQLGEPLQHVFNLSLRLGRVPATWKTTCLIPVPKKAHPKELNDYRPVALTSHVMKTMERLLLNHLRPQVHHAENPLRLRTGRRWEWKMPSSNFYTELTLIWTRGVVL
ncbi:hypothetical protein NFI96_006207, partial [Prochilodus magdalenae]